MSPRSRTLVTLGAASFLAGAPRAFESGAAHAVSVSMLTIAGIGFALVGVGLMLSSHVRERLAGALFVIGALAMLPIVPVDLALTVMFGSAAIGAAVMATAKGLPSGLRPALAVSAGCAAVFAVAFAPMAQLAMTDPLLVSAIGLGVGGGLLLGIDRRHARVSV